MLDAGSIIIMISLYSICVVLIFILKYKLDTLEEKIKILHEDNKMIMDCNNFLLERIKKLEENAEATITRW
jgi:hypothetical protein